MNGGLTTYMKDRIMNLMFSNQNIESFENVYIGLFNSNPMESGEEVNKKGYKRVSAKFGESSLGEVINQKDIFFEVALEPWGEIRYIGIFDKAVDGNLIWYGNFEYPKNYDISDQMKIPKGLFSLKLS